MTNSMLNLALIFIGKIVSKTVQTLNLGNGSTWPGHIALKVNKNFVQDILEQTHLKIILIAGTNGKTTTSSLICEGLEKSGKSVIQNQSGANLLNGVASTLLLNATAFGEIKQNYAIFEVDENALPKVLQQLTPDYLVLLNLFRDQLDRYGEVNTIATNWKKSLENLDNKTTLILNADDPLIASLGHTPHPNPLPKGAREHQSSPSPSEGEGRGEGKKVRDTLYFGLQDSQFSIDQTQHAADSVHCPQCGEKLVFKAIAFSHLGNWECQQCGLKRPKIEKNKFVVYPLPGMYNKYNTLAAIQVLKHIGLTDIEVEDAFLEFKPAFGRQEIVTYKGKKVQIFLSKNPTSFNQSYTTIKNLGATVLLLVLNDRIPDGRDVSWIWDTDLPEIKKFKHIIVSGDRLYDMALRIKYEGHKNFQTFENLQDAIDAGIDLIGHDERLFILPTYSAMLESRKVLTGKKIL